MRRTLAIAGAALACAVGGAPLHAQGSGVDQQSACMSGRVGAGVASPCDDASAVYFTPAGLALHGSVVSLGVTVVRTSATFRYHTNAAPPTEDNPIRRDAELVPVPQAFASYRASPKLAVGVGAFAPFGLSIDWPVCPVDNPQCAEQNFEGRYTGYDQTLRALFIQPTIAYQVTPALTVGAGLDYVRMNIEVHQRADAPQLGLQGRDFADAALKGDGNGWTGQLGAIYRLSPRTSVGARFLFAAEVDLSGDADFTQIPTGTVFDAVLAGQFAAGQQLADQPISTTVELPSQLVVGVSHRPTERLNLLLDYQWSEWSNFDQFDIHFQDSNDTTVLNLGYRDTNTFRFAAEYGWSEALALRAGFRYNTAATPRASPFLPEGERNYYTAGLGYRVTDRLSADLSFQYVDQPDRAGTVRPGGQEVGVYSTSGQTFGFTLAYRFGGGGQ